MSSERISWPPSSLWRKPKPQVSILLLANTHTHTHTLSPPLSRFRSPSFCRFCVV
jgi:hypothetical protein